MKGYVGISQQHTGIYRNRFYICLNCHSTVVEHCKERRVAYASLTGNIEISMCERGSITSEVIWAIRTALQFRHNALVVLQKDEASINVNHNGKWHGPFTNSDTLSIMNRDIPILNKDNMGYHLI